MDHEVQKLFQQIKSAIHRSISYPWLGLKPEKCFSMIRAARSFVLGMIEWLLSQGCSWGKLSGKVAIWIQIQDK